MVLLDTVARGGQGLGLSSARAAQPQPPGITFFNTRILGDVAADFMSAQCNVSSAAGALEFGQNET
jgi:hypothetical protein